MKIECDENVASIITTAIISAAIVSVILGAGLMIHRSSIRDSIEKYSAIKSAKTCEQMVLIQESGSASEILNQLYACKSKPLGINQNDIKN